MRLLAAFAVIAAVAGGAPAIAAPANLNKALDRVTDKGAFRVRVASVVSPIPMSKIHQWRVQVTGRNGKPVSGAVIAVNGGMPEHHHGLPTKPTAAAGSAPGEYLISGMKFSMDGWWELKLAVAAGGATDTVTFNIVL